MRVSGKGLGDYKKSINMTLPWEGGWWRLGDLVEYEISSTFSIIKTASKRKSDLLKFRNYICRKNVLKGTIEAPFHYVLHKNQHDPGELAGILNLLDEHGVDVYKTNSETTIGTTIISKGDYVIPLAQPFHAFIKEVMEKQKFPERHYTPGGQMIRPYDITSWSLPLHRGVKSLEVNVQSDLGKIIEKVEFPLAAPKEIPETAKTIIFPVSRNESFKAIFQSMAKKISVYRLCGIEDFPDGLNKGDFLVEVSEKNRGDLNEIVKGLNVDPIYTNDEFPKELKELSLPKIALVETNFHDMDAGWTRYILDTYSIPFTQMKPEEFEKAKLEDFDVILFPSNSKDVLLSGKRKRSDGSYSIPFYDPKFVKGMGKKGLNNLLKFVNDGGVILTWGASSGLFMGTLSIETDKDNKEEFSLPVSDMSSTLKTQKLSVPGSLLRINLVKDHPLTYGMPETIGVFSKGGPVFSTSIPDFDMDRRVIASYPDDNILMSGFAENEDVLAEKSALVWLKKGKGQIVMYGFNPQFRASTQGTFKLLFNGLFIK